jgi:hypothetical protein
MAFPHPQSSNYYHRDGDESNNGGVVRDFFERTINITDDRNGKDDMNPAKDRALGGFFHDVALYDCVIVRETTIGVWRASCSGLRIAFTCRVG